MTRNWRDALLAFRDKRVAALLFLGFSAGLPFLLVFSTLSVWLREAGVERAAIGFFSWAALGYGFKFVWAPLIDKLPVPVLATLLGRRRAWLLVAQGAIAAALFLMGATDPATDLSTMALFAVLLGFSSATQDIVIDAYRIETAGTDMQGLLSSVYIAGYRIGMLTAGAGALEIAGLLDGGNGYDPAAWATTYKIMAAIMGVGVATTILIREPEVPETFYKVLRPVSDHLRFLAVFVAAVCAFIGVFSATGGGTGAASFPVEALRLLLAVIAAIVVGTILVRLRAAPRDMIEDAYIAPFRDFFVRFGRAALIILALIATYRIADVVMGVMANVFYVDLGFDKQDIGRITKGFGLIMTLTGGFLGGVAIVRYGVRRVLFVGAVLAAATNLLFAGLAWIGADIRMLMLVIAADNLSAGIASAAFVAYLSGLTSGAFTATQYALFSSLMLLLPKLLAGYSGMMIEAVGYAPFFIGTALLGLPVLALVIWGGKYARGDAP